METGMDNTYTALPKGSGLLPHIPIIRRTFLKTGGIMTALTLSGEWKGWAGSKGKREFSFAVITDLHYADKDTAGTRHYRDSRPKLKKAIETFNGKDPRFLIELGDVIDAADKETELGYLRTINATLKEFDGPCHYVLGNHDVATFSKEEFIAGSGMKAPYYSFDEGDYHFVVLDANFLGDGTPYNAGNFVWTDTIIPTQEQDWLKRDLAAAGDRPTIVFVHQNLHDESNPHGVKNAPDIRALLENASNVRHVFQGHDHNGAYAEINGIHYLTLKAAVEGPYPANNAYAMVYLHADGSLTVEGYAAQESRKPAI